MGACCAPSRDAIEASKPVQLCLVPEDSSTLHKQTLESWEKETVAQLIEREYGLRKHLRAKLKFVFSDTEVPHSERLEEAGIMSEAEVQIIGLREALEAKQRELDQEAEMEALRVQQRRVEQDREEKAVLSARRNRREATERYM